MLRLVFLEGTLWVLGSLVAVLALGLLGDWLLNWSSGLRRALVAVYLGVGLWIVWRRWIRPWRAVPKAEGLARYMEQQHPAFRSRLISAVQLSGSDSIDPEVGVPFVRRMVKEAVDVAESTDFRKLVPATSLVRVAWVVIPFVALVGLILTWATPTSGILLRRALGAEEPLPRKTRLLEVTGARQLGRGDDLQIVAVAEGVLPKAGKLVVRHASGRIQTLPLDPDPAQSGRYERVLGNLTSTLQYRVEVNDAASEEFEVRVLPRPVVTNLILSVEYPRYTGLAPRSVVPGELTLLRGSRLWVEAFASQALSNAAVRLEGLDSERPAELDPANPSHFRVAVTAEDVHWTGFSLRMTDTLGIASRDPAVYAVEVVEDQPPTVRVVLPARREELVTARGTVLVAFEAKDDFGLAGLRLAYQPASGTNTQPSLIELALDTVMTNSVRRRFEWKLADLRPPPADGTFLEFWIEALDRREIGGPGVGRSERYMARVVSEAEKRSDLLTRAGDAIGRLGDVAQGQDRLNESLGRIILEKASPRQ